MFNADVNTLISDHFIIPGISKSCNACLLQVIEPISKSRVLEPCLRFESIASDPHWWVASALDLGVLNLEEV